MSNPSSNRLLKVPYEGFKKISSEFMNTLPLVTDLDSAENMWKCLGLAYLNAVYEDNELGRHYEAVQAPIIMKLCSTTYIKHVAKLKEKPSGKT